MPSFLKRLGRLLLTKQAARDALAAFSLANLCLLRFWDILLFNSASRYLLKTPGNPVDYWAAIINVLILGSLLWGVVIWMRRKLKPWAMELATCIFLAVLLVPIDFIRRALGWHAEIIWRTGGIWVGTAIAGLIFWWRVRLKQIFLWILVILSPFCLLTVTQACWCAVRGEKPMLKASALPFSGFSKHIDARRLIWVIFDEWDQGVTFDRRPPDLKLPNIDSFAKTAVIATQAYPPAGYTMLSIPSLLTGRYLVEALQDGYGHLMVREPTEVTKRDFLEIPNVLADLAKDGKRVAVVGWLHPYSRILPNEPNFWIHWEEAPQGLYYTADGLSKTVIAQLRMVFIPQAGRDSAVESFLRVQEAASSIAKNPAVDLAFLHYPIPHNPSIYDRENNSMSSQYTNSAQGYLNNLALADRVLGNLVADIAAAGLHDRTTLILSSDHWWRVSPLVSGERDHRVPLMIQLPGEKSAVIYDTPINTVSVAGVVNDIVRGAVEDRESLVKRLLAATEPGPFRYGKDGVLLNPPSTRTNAIAK